MKKHVCLFLLFAVLISMLSVPAFAAGETEVTISRSDVLIHVTAKLSRGTEAPIVILHKGDSLANVSTSAEVKEKVIYLDQLSGEEYGTISQSFYLPKLETGSYVVRMGQCYDVTCTEVPEFFATAWGDSFTDEHIIPMYSLKETGTTTNDEPVFDYSKMASAAKETLNILPAGRRYIHVVGELQHMAANDKAAQNYIWWDNGVSELKTHMENFLTAYKAIGGLLDGVVIDFETGMSRDYLLGIADGEATAIAKAQWEANKTCSCTDYSDHVAYCSSYDSLAYSTLKKERYQNMAEAISGDERFADILPELVERGFVVNEDGLSATIYNLISKGYSDSNIYSWDVTMGRRVSSYLNEALFDVVASYYPEASGSDYGSSDTNAANMFAGNGHPFYKAGNSKKAGTHSSTSLYGTLITTKGQYWADDATYTKTGFSLLKYEVNAMKAAIQATDDGAIQPWVGNPQFGYQSTTKDKNGNITKNTKTSYTGNTPWYREMIFHVGLLNPDPFLYWGPRYYSTDEETYVQKNAQMLSDMIEELNSVAGYSQRKPLTTAMDSWNTDFVLTGMQVGDSSGSKNIWRITPNLEVQAMYDLLNQTVKTEGVTGVTRDSFCIDAATPTFKIEGTTITFPQGTIVAEKNIINFDAKSATGQDLYKSYENESYGYWVETPAGVMPTVTYDPDFYAVSDEGFKAEILAYEDDGTQTTVLPESGEVTIRLSYKNLSGALQDAKLFLAVYNGDKLLDIETLYEGSIQFGEDGYKICELGTLSQEADKVQLLLWDGTENLKPLKGAKILN